ncbi:hypothetical protein T484DRAFT_1747618 [Baffinella frigidus]|nr:hypothetical protein T484DRAFT_1747618 [Cryptophyta sp. CCMP2293]
MAPPSGGLHIPDEWNRENSKVSVKHIRSKHAQPTVPVGSTPRTGTTTQEPTPVTGPTLSPNGNPAPHIPTTGKRKRAKSATGSRNGSTKDAPLPVPPQDSACPIQPPEPVPEPEPTLSSVFESMHEPAPTVKHGSSEDPLPANNANMARGCDETESVMRGLYHQVEKLARRPGCALVEGIYLDCIMTHIPYVDVLVQMFGGDSAIIKPCVPLVTRAYEESYMREVVRGGEEPCVMGTNCECQFVDEHNPFIGVQFTLPIDILPSDADTEMRNGSNEASGSGAAYELSGNKMCVLCCRKNTQSLFYDALYNHRTYNGCIQLYGNICDRPGFSRALVVSLLSPSSSSSSYSTISSSTNTSTTARTTDNKSRSTANAAGLRGKGGARGRGGNGNGDGDSGENSTRLIFPLSNNFHAVRKSGLFPVLAEKEECGKGDGEGSSLQDSNKTKHKKKKRSKSSRPVNPASALTEQDDECTPEFVPGNPPPTEIHSRPIPAAPLYPVVSDYPEIDKVVHELYDIFTKDPGTMVQIQIDRYLFAADTALVAECGGDMRTCVLHESQVPSIFRLPDLIYILRQRLVEGSWANATQEAVCRYTIPGMQKSRWVTRSRKVSASVASAGGSGRTTGCPPVHPDGLSTDDDTDPLATVYINTLLGLLLGLYPRCSKRPGFALRVRIVRTVRALLSSSVKTQNAFIKRYVNLVRLAMVEYFANVLELYCPTEFQLLQKHVDVDAYVNLCRSSCDLFRVNNLSEEPLKMGGIQTLDWDSLDKLAYKTTDKIIRSTRVETKLANHVPTHHKSIKKLVTSDVYKNTESCDEFLSLVKNCAVACWHEDYSYIYQQMLTELQQGPVHTTPVKVNGFFLEGVGQLEEEDLPVRVGTETSPGTTQFGTLTNCSLDLNLVISDIHSVVSVTMLPANFVLEQVATLRSLYKFDTVQMLARTKKNICLHCLLRIAPKQFQIEEAINGNIRSNLDTDQLFCNRCMSSKHVVSIDLIGQPQKPKP